MNNIPDMLKDTDFHFPWNNSPDVYEQYSNSPNFEIYDCPHSVKTHRVCIFFCSNGVYFPNSCETFLEKVVQQNRFEWKRTAHKDSVEQYYDRIIFVRDVYKQWYITGINGCCNTVDKTAELLRNLCGDTNITTCGNSAGGYAAVWFGILLHAEVIFSFSGQFTLEYDRGEEEPFIDLFGDNIEYAKCYDLAELIRSYNKNNSFYLCPYDYQLDCQQYEYLLSKGEDVTSKTHILMFSSKDHGITVPRVCYPIFLTDNNAVLDACKRYEGSIISANRFCWTFLPVNERILYFLHQLLNWFVEKYKGLVQKVSRIVKRLICLQF